MTNPQRLRVLWLCSWYPSHVEPFSGDFIQRQAKAVSAFSDIHVLHAVGSRQQRGISIIKQESKPNLREWIAYYSTSRIYQRWFSALQWLRVMWSMFCEYRRAYGLPDLVHVQILYKSGLIGRYLLARHGIPYVVTEHWGIYQEQSADRFRERSFLFRWITRFGYKKAALSISVSDFQARQLRTYLFSVSSRTANNVVNTRLFHYVKPISRPFTFLHVSDWSENKNPEAIIQAFDRLHRAFPQTRLVLVGGKGVRGQLIRERAQATGAAIHCEGEVSYEAVARFMQQADCFVLYSDMENSPCVIGEALCSGLFVIASDVGGVAELMDPVGGLLLPPRNEEALYQGMKQAMEVGDQIDREELSQRAQLRFSYETIGRSIDEAYREVLGNIETDQPFN